MADKHITSDIKYVGAVVVKTATIANGESLSGAVELQGFKFFSIVMPAAWTTANLTFQGSDDGVTFQDIYMNGAEVVETVIAGKTYAIDQNILALAAIPYLKIRSGTSASAVAQAAQRSIKVVCSY
jgi:hypothetical protein